MKRMRATSLQLVLTRVLLLCLIAGTGCFARSPDFDPSESAEHRKAAEQYVLERAEERWGYGRPSSRDRRPDYREGYYLHIGGTTTCDGWPRTKQKTHVYTWVTEYSPTGRRVKVKRLVAGFDYTAGFFKGSGVSSAREQTSEVAAHDMIAGYDEESICQCVQIFASARIRGRLFLRSREKLCPEL